jgi:hypothetical protein
MINEALIQLKAKVVAEISQKRVETQYQKKKRTQKRK